MLLPTVAFLLLLLVYYQRSKGPIWVMAIAWLIAIVPVASGVARYGFFKPSLDYDLTLIAYLSCFLAGSIIYSLIQKPVVAQSQGLIAQPSDTVMLNDVSTVLPTARLCWWIGIIGVIFLVIDFRARGADLSDLSNVRQSFGTAVLTSKTGMSIYWKLGSVMVWACIYSYLFSMTYWGQLTRKQLFWFMIPVAGYFLVGLLIAGRQTAFQIVLMTLLTLMVLSKRRISVGSARSMIMIGGSISVLMVAYMGFIASARDAGVISDDHSVVLGLLFDYTVDPSVEKFQNLFGMKVKSFFNEAIVYFSNSIPLFKTMLSLKMHDIYFGANTFPFFMRQIEPLTGISVQGALNDQYSAMEGAGVMSTGWVTAIAAYIMDFGRVGAGIFLFIQGFYIEHAWRRGIASRDFHDIVIATLMLVTVVYMPMLPGISDTSISICWLFCLFVKFHTSAVLAARVPARADISSS